MREVNLHSLKKVKFSHFDFGKTWGMIMMSKKVKLTEKGLGSAKLKVSLNIEACSKINLSVIFLLLKIMSGISVPIFSNKLLRQFVAVRRPIHVL